MSWQVIALALNMIGTIVVLFPLIGLVRLTNDPRYLDQDQRKIRICARVGVLILCVGFIVSFLVILDSYFPNVLP